MSATIAHRPIEAPRQASRFVDDRLCEIVDGIPREKSRGVREIEVMSLLGQFLGHFATTNRLGRVLFEMLFDFGDPARPKRRPDVAYVSFERWARGRKVPDEDAWKVVPDLAVEVVSPSNSANEVEAKVVEYLAAGVRLVWVVHPATGRVYGHDGSPSVRVFSGEGPLDGGAVLPGFQLPLKSLFEAETA